MAKKKQEFRVQRQNANRHTDEGASLLNMSIQENGWIGAITVAADHEAFDGSLRLQTVQEVFEGVEPIVIRSSGDRPIIHIREDIASADDPRAKRLSVDANRIAEVSLDWDTEVLDDWSDELNLDEFWVIPKVYQSDADPLSRPTYEKPETTATDSDDDEQLDDDETDRVEPRIDGDKYPLPIVLSWKENQRWTAVKQSFGLKTDKRAFLELLERWENG